MFLEKKFQKQLIIYGAGILAVAFIGLVYFEWGKGGVTGGGTFEVARIGTKSVYLQEFREVYENIKSQMETETSTVDENKNRQILLTALQTLIQKYLTLKAADKADVSVSKDAVFANIVRMKQFQTESGQFNEYLYNYLPKSVKRKIENETRETLIQQLFQLRLLDAVKVSDLDLRFYFQQKYDTRKIRFAFFKFEKKSPADKNPLGIDTEKAKVEKLADNFINVAKKSSFETAANSLGIKIYTTDFFSFFGPIKKENKSDQRWTELEFQEVYQTSFSLQPFQGIEKIMLPDGIAVIQVIGFTQPDWNKFYYELSKLKNELENIYRNYAFQQWYINEAQNTKIINNINKLLKEEETK